ncbi:MAG: hypothetical protein RR203_07540 [Synergistaceae bacterium]
MYSFLSSPYLHIALLLSLLILSFSNSNEKTMETLIKAGFILLPCSLGFSTTGISIFISSGDEKFKKKICSQKLEKDNNENNSVFLSVVATFVHYIIVNMLALLNIICFRIIESTSLIYSFITLFLFIYAILLGFATLFSLQTIARWNDWHYASLNEQGNPCNNLDKKP